MLDQWLRDAHGDRLHDLRFGDGTVHVGRGAHVAAGLRDRQRVTLGQSPHRLRGAVAAAQFERGVEPFGALLSGCAGHGSYNNAPIRSSSSPRVPPRASDAALESQYRFWFHVVTTLYFESDPPFSDKRRFGEGRYLLRSNLTAEDPATLWRYYLQLTEVEQAFKELKHDLAIRPIFHQREDRIEAHIFVAFIAYCLHVTLKNLARPCAPGLTPRAILEKFATLQMLDVHLPTTDGRYLILPRHTQPQREHQLLLDQLKLRLPEQPTPRILD